MRHLSPAATRHPSWPGLVAALLAALSCALVARASRADETAALPVSEVSLSLPGAPGAWTVASHGKFDVLRRRYPAGVELEIRLIVRPHETDDCEVVLTGIEASMGGQGKLAPRPPYVPSSWASSAVELQQEGKWVSSVCAERAGGGRVLAIVGVRGGELRSLASEIRQVLSAYLGAIDAVAMPSLGMAPAVPDTEKLLLAATGVTVQAPAHWHAALVQTRGDERADRLDRRVSGARPMAVIVGPQGQSCETWERTGRQDAASGFRFVSTPPYLPAGWHPTVAVREQDGSRTMVLCADVGDGKLQALVAYDGALGDPAMREASELLRQVARAAGAAVGRPAGGAAAPADGRAAHAQRDVSRATDARIDGFGGGAPGPHRGEGPDGVADDDEWEPLGLGVEATVLHLGPDNDVVDGTVGVTGGVYSTFHLFDSDYFGLDLHVDGALGHTGQGNWMGNVGVGAQPIIRLGPVGLSMVGGAGWDTISGSDAPTIDEAVPLAAEPVFKVPSAIYGFVGARMNFEVISAVALVGGVDQCFRNDATVGSETRVNGGARLWFGGPVSFRLLFRFVHYAVSDDFAALGGPSVDALGGSLGVGF